MATHPSCDIEVGEHPGPFWKSGKLFVCTRHKGHYEERADEFGPFDWKFQTEEDQIQRRLHGSSYPS